MTRSPKWGRRAWTTAFAVTGLLVFGAAPAAADFVVTTTADGTDDGECAVDCTLREAIERSDANPGVDTVTVPANASAYTVSQGTIFANQALTLKGAGTSQTRINAQPNASGQQVIQFVGVGTTTVEDLTVQGQDDGGGAPVLLSAIGGDQTNSFFNLTRVAITGNTNNGGGGGAITLTSGFMRLTDSTVAGNNANGAGGGGIHIASSSTRAEIVNSTIANNTTQQSGGGIFVDGMFGAPSDFVIRNSTISGNNAPNQSGGALFIVGPVKLSYSTITGNTANAAAGNGGSVFGVPAQTILKGNIFQSNNPQNCVLASNPVREGFNFDNADSCRLGSAPGANANDRPNTAVTLNALADNGGPTQTHALASGSAAIDAGGLGGCTAVGGGVLGTDQRGQPRPAGPACDSGAFEVQPIPAGGGGGGGGGGGTTGPTAIAALSGLVVTPQSFVAAGSGGSVGAQAKGATVSYSSTQQATTTFRVQRRLRGYRKGRRCLLRRPAGVTHPRRCTLFRRVRGSFTHQTAAGQNSFRFTGRLRGRKLRPGRYRLNAVARNSFGASKVRRAAFRIKRR